MVARPNPPGLEEKVEFIWREIIDPCDAPLTIWIDLMWEPLGQLLLEYYALDALNVITTYARPTFGPLKTRLGRKYGYGVKPRRGIHWGKLREWVFMDPGELIGTLLAGSKEAEQVPPGRFRAMSWAIFGVIERALFWWMVLELLTDFLYRWLSLLQETRYCQARDDAVFYSDTPGNVSIGILGWSATGWGTPEKSRRILFYNGFGVMQATGYGLASFTGTAVGRQVPETGSISARIRVIAGPNTGRVATMTRHTVDQEEATFSLYIEIGPNDTVVVETLADDQIYDWPQQTFYIHATP